MNYYKTALFSFIAIAFCTVSLFAQSVNFPAPREEKLLNGLKVLIWKDNSAQKATVKIRIHNGAAFDPKDKSGVMALLSDILFPTEQAKAYFTEDLEGSLNAAANYDYIQITATGKTEELQAMLETLATAVVNPQINKENFDIVRQAHLKKVAELEKNPAYIADRAIAERLYGDFPYGRNSAGTSQSLAAIDTADLIKANDRFFTADNATVAVIGNVNSDFVYRAARRLFGGWKKSGVKIPSTFREADAPLTGKQFIEFPDAQNANIFQASRFAARNSKDYQAGLILTDILSNRLKKTVLDFQNSNPGNQVNVSIRSEPYFLNGVFVIGITAPADKADAFVKTSHDQNLLRPITAAEFEKSKNFLISTITGTVGSKSSLSEMWLDSVTYKLAAPAEQFKKLQNTAISDVSNLMKNSLANAPFVEVVVGDPAKLKDFQSNSGQTAN